MGAALPTSRKRRASSETRSGASSNPVPSTSGMSGRAWRASLFQQVVRVDAEPAAAAQPDDAMRQCLRVGVREQVEDERTQAGAAGGGGQSARGDADKHDIGFALRP
ncbi:hypothetical protein ACFSKM_17670 [Ancylobacter dichloromethanicus]